MRHFLYMSTKTLSLGNSHSRSVSLNIACQIAFQFTPQRVSVLLSMTVINKTIVHIGESFLATLDFGCHHFKKDSLQKTKHKNCQLSESVPLFCRMNNFIPLFKNFIKFFLLLFYYTCPHISSLPPSTQPPTPLPQSIPTPLSMSMDHPYIFLD